MKNTGTLLPAILCMSLSVYADASSSSIRDTSAIASSVASSEKGPVITSAKAARPMLTDADFSLCLSTFSSKASAAGISQTTINGPLAKANLNVRVQELDRQQPEFTTTFSDYFNRRVNEQRVKQGRELLQKHRTMLNKVEQQYGVAAPYLLAFWGLETNFGGYFGNIPIIDSLATLACDPRRSKFFTAELMAALQIIDEGAIEPNKMVGSWAGAMGHVQFMPSNFLRYAVDADGNGKRNLWESTYDAMASGGNFLQQLGWQEGERWGREVKLPSNFPYIEAGLGNVKTLAEWSALGVRRADNSALPKADMSAALLVPAGHTGPAFLVYKNFNVIMRWNRSEFYALSVGVLADRIAGTGKLLQAPPKNALRLHRSQVLQLQEALMAGKLYTGKADGIFGPATRRAISQLQQQHGLVADGFTDEKVLKLLNVSITPIQRE